MTPDEALAIVNAIFAPDPLNSIQIYVFRHCWTGQTYEEIATTSGYTPDYIRRIGSLLWKSLSERLGQKITKDNIHTVLGARSQQWRSHLIALKATETSQSFSFSAYDSSEQLVVPEFPGGPLPLDSPYYMTRPPLEEQACRAVLRPGALVRIKAPEKLGKTSLMERVLAYAKVHGFRTAQIDFQQVDGTLLTNLDRYLRWFCAVLTQQLHLKSAVSDFWDADLGSKVSCTNYFQGHVLANLDQPVVVALDECQRLFEYPALAQEFFPLLRVWHGSARTREIWSKLRFVIVYSTELYLPLNLNQSPFNIGLPLRLQRFNWDQTQAFAQQLGLDQAANSLSKDDLNRLHVLVAGHPYFLHLAVYHLLSGEAMGIEKLLEEAPTSTGIYSEHLRKQLLTLQKHPDLATAFKAVITADTWVELDTIAAYKLESMGLVNLQGNSAMLSCDLYRLYFREHLNQF